MKKSALKLTLFRYVTFAVLLCVFFSNVHATDNRSSNHNNKKSKSNLLQTITITGKITSSSDDPLPGVNITVKGTNTGVTTDINGNYSISVPGKEAVIVYSFIGYLTEEMQVGEQTVINLKLVEDITQVDEVVVTAFGIKREEKSLGYAVSSIKAEDLTMTGTTNFASALYGKAAGVRINAANGGASSAVNIQIRGVTSVNNNTQPLYVVDGIPIRNHALLNYDNATNNAQFWDETRVRENGVLDINPEDIKSLTVLKGASASALYGSEAANGVIVITTKSGSHKKKGLGVDVGFQFDFERLAFQPEYQNAYGPGYGREINSTTDGYISDEGWVTEDDGAIHPYYGSAYQFGPKFDGREVSYWDGSTVSYSAKKNNYRDFFDKGYNATTNVAFSNGSDIGSYRFSYSNTDYKGIMPGYKMNKNYFNFNGSLKLNDRVNIDLVSSYTHTFTHNRPYMLNQLFTSFSGFFSRMDDMSVYREKYQTTKGYKYVKYNQDYDDDEKLAYSMSSTNLLDYYWTQLKNSYDENQNRFINSVTLNLKLTEKLNIRGRIGNDFTSIKTEKKEHNQYPTAYGYSGSYEVQSGQYSLLYGDAFLNYNEHLTSDLTMNLSAGYSGKKDVYNDSKSGTNGGLVVENWFSLKNSASTFTTSQISSSTKKQAYQAAFGIADFSYREFLYLQGTARYEATSTLPPGANSYFYPSFNGSFVFSEVVQLPAFINYAKLRSSWGIVGNHPSMYAASVSYSVSQVYSANGNAVYQEPSGSEYGNDDIKSEKKYETEVGLEFSMFQNRVGLDISYYNNIIQDQIMYLSTPASSGASSLLTNVGKLGNNGLEVAISATPVQTSQFRWDTRFNFGVNKNKLLELMDGVEYLTMSTPVSDGGSIVIRAAEGEALGDIYVHPIATDGNGNKVVNEYGLYNIDYENYEKVGSVMPKAVGGFSNTLSFKNFMLDFVIDYKIGGSLVSRGMHYMTGAGMFKSTMKYRDAENGGLSYNINDDGDKILANDGAYHDGIILEGVDEEGNTNQTIVDAPTYYIYSFGWGSGSGYYNRYENAVNKNSYIKLREVALSYMLPKDVTSKIGFQTIRISVMGKNIAYLWKTLPNNWDPESATGSNWLYQGLDEGAAAPTRSFGFAIRASF